MCWTKTRCFHQRNIMYCEVSAAIDFSLLPNAAERQNPTVLPDRQLHSFVQTGSGIHSWHALAHRRGFNYRYHFRYKKQFWHFRTSACPLNKFIRPELNANLSAFIRDDSLEPDQLLTQAFYLSGKTTGRFRLSLSIRLIRWSCTWPKANMS